MLLKANTVIGAPAGSILLILKIWREGKPVLPCSNAAGAEGCRPVAYGKFKLSPNFPSSRSAT